MVKKAKEGYEKSSTQGQKWAKSGMKGLRTFHEPMINSPEDKDRSLQGLTSSVEAFVKSIFNLVRCSPTPDITIPTPAPKWVHQSADLVSQDSPV